jgi:thiosulfate/3-mercaptopyruvate sulfurtransferase
MRSNEHRDKLKPVSFTTLIDASSLRELLAGAERPLVVLDCRFDLKDPDAGRRAYLAGRIPGAHYADLNRDLAAPVSADSGRHPLPSPAAAAGFFQGLGIGDDTQVVAYDEANGSFAARAWWLLNWLGHPGVAVLDGGYAAWVREGGPVDSGAPHATAGNPRRGDAHAPRFTARPQAKAAATAAEVLEALEDPRRVLVDARAPERFAGIVEPLDPVAGHVPGAVNHPFTDNLDSQGRFLGAAELRRRWSERLAGRAPEDMIAMCGSGVTACHNLLALARAGLPGAKLYPGSWSEWIRDPARPVARGNLPLPR